MKDSRSSAVRGAFFFVGAMLAFTSCEAVDVFALGHYEHKWTPGENFRLATLASAVLMGIVATLFAVTTVLGARHTGVNRSSCAVLGAAYSTGAFLLTQFLPGVLNPEGWPIVIVTWSYVLGAPVFLGFLVSRRRSLEEAVNGA